MKRYYGKRTAASPKLIAWPAEVHMRSVLVDALVVLSATVLVAKQTSPPQTTAPKTDSTVTAAQAAQDFAAERWPEALKEYTALHQASPEDAKIAETLATVALNVGNDQLAISTLEPIEKADSARWMVSMLLARAYAETKRDADRDREIERLQRLHDTKLAPKIAALDSFLLEVHSSPKETVRIWYALSPLGSEHVYVLARIYDPSGKQIFHISLNSSDRDQAVWAKDHAKDAAARQRVFFLDSYSRPTSTGNGPTQALIGMYSGRPAYNIVRDIMLAGVSAGSKTPLIVPTP